MIHYHGLPITPEAIVAQVMTGAHFFVSFEYPEQLTTAVAIGASFAADNGAFSKWKKGAAPSDWSPFYNWIDEIQHNPKFDFAVIPDVIDGGEEDNDALLAQWPFRPGVGAPVWHLHESLDRLARLAHEYPRVCLGSSGRYAQIGTPEWWQRMSDSMKAICNPEGFPTTKLHGLRMLDPKLVAAFPFKSCDSTNIARNIGIDSAWSTGAYLPPTKAARAAVMRQRIESAQSPCVWHEGIAAEEFTFML